MNSRTQSVIVYILLFAAIIALVVYGMNRPQAEDEVFTINQLASEIMSGNVSKITVEEDKLTVLDKSGLVERTATKETNSTLVEQLLALGVTPDQLSPDNGISIEIKTPSKLWEILNTAFLVLPLIVGYFGTDIGDIDTGGNDLVVTVTAKCVFVEE